ncbi:hypothetical protein HJC23_003570 [Cyclotella cryptica]|uniref:Protein kinase domain-containing protein n=1 Tax=Cyclotella cryptica TaxID=29204 RepID=A0ABD3NPT3_9STRA
MPRPNTQKREYYDQDSDGWSTPNDFDPHLTVGRLAQSYQPTLLPALTPESTSTIDDENYSIRHSSHLNDSHNSHDRHSNNGAIYAKSRYGDMKRARKRRRTISNCLFYSSFALAISSIVFMDGKVQTLINEPSSNLRIVGPRKRKHYEQTVVTRRTVFGFRPFVATFALPRSTSKKRGRLKDKNKHITSEKKESTVQIGRNLASPWKRHKKNKPWAADLLIQNEVELNPKRIQPRMFYIDPSMADATLDSRVVQLYPAVFSDNTQLYPVLDSNDVEMVRMERRPPYNDGECAPMKEWQTASYPTCNLIHELDTLQQSKPDIGGGMQLFGTKGHWRNAMSISYACKGLNYGSVKDCKETVVVKTLKYHHNFEDAFYELNRIDALAMERLTSSPHVIDIFGFCAHSVITEFADGQRVGTLADKSKRKPLARLKIARDIARGLADVHEIDGYTQATLVHHDINLENVVSINGTLKLNDFNLAVILKRNVTSGVACGFSADYPNPYWRSPEEANHHQNLTEKIDVFSLGHIFFRLICLHEPWNKLEPGGKPSKEMVTEKVKRGILPYIPADVMETSDPEVAVIRDAMLACYTTDPVERPKARTIADYLDRSLKKLSDDPTP